MSDDPKPPTVKLVERPDGSFELSVDGEVISRRTIPPGKADQAMQAAQALAADRHAMLKIVKIEDWTGRDVLEE